MPSLQEAFSLEKRMGGQSAFGSGKEAFVGMVCIGRPGPSAALYVHCKRSRNGTVLSPYTGLHGA